MKADKVKLISGGAAGIIPRTPHFSVRVYTGCRNLWRRFASPSQIQVYQKIKATSGDKGTPVDYNNYSGNTMNFRAILI